MIDTPNALRELVARLRDEPCVALDTEFVWERTYRARLGLVQAALADETCFLLDPIALTELAPFGEILADTRIIKILHDAPQDLMVLRQATGASACRVFDTRLAAGFTGLSSVISLSNLLSELLDVHLPKEHTRADWTARPFPPEILEYAVDDVRYLPQAAGLLRRRTGEAGVEAWLDEELATLDESVLYEEKEPAEVYLRIRAAVALPPRELAVLRELAAWREEQARAVDRPRRWIAEDHELVSVAKAFPRQPGDLVHCRQLNPKTARRYGHDLLAAVERGLAIPDPAQPPSLLRPRISSSLKKSIDEAIRQIRTRAESRGIDAQLVSTRNDVALLMQEGAAARPENHRLLRGWRAELLDGTLSNLQG